MLPDNCDFTYSWPCHFQILSPPAYIFWTSFVSWVLPTLLVRPVILYTPVFWLFNSLKTAPNSSATMFSSKTPNLIFLVMLSITLSGSAFFPGPNISSIIILNDSPTVTLPPMCPWLSANKLAEPKLRACVAGE